MLVTLFDFLENILKFKLIFSLPLLIQIKAAIGKLFLKEYEN